MKFALITLDIRNGEYEYTSHSTHQVEDGQDLDKFADDYARTFYMSDMSEDFPGVYFFHNGEVAVEVDLAREIPFADYEVFKRYGI
jgi:hypothetical protein